jgi:hypothetical protein
MKTTIDIDDALLKRARHEAVNRGTTLRAIIEEALARALGGRADDAPPPLRTLTWPPPGASFDVPDEAAIRAALAFERRERFDPPQ